MNLLLDGPEPLVEMEPQAKYFRLGTVDEVSLSKSIFDAAVRSAQARLETVRHDTVAGMDIIEYADAQELGHLSRALWSDAGLPAYLNTLALDIVIGGLEGTFDMLRIRSGSWINTFNANDTLKEPVKISPGHHVTGLQLLAFRANAKQARAAIAREFPLFEKEFTRPAKRIGSFVIASQASFN